jgi:hypothetical protein
MLDLFRRWFGRPSSSAPQAASLRPWAEAAGWRFAPAKGNDGFVVEGKGDGPHWRAEWGPAQRDYIGERELRIRADIGDAGDLQMLVIARSLMNRLENDVFEQVTEGNQTRMDDRTPEEMRWLVLFPTVPRATLGPLRERFAALANRPAAAPLWLEGALSQALQAAAPWLAADTPFAMVVQRGRFVLRLALPQPDEDTMQRAIDLAVVAAAAARRVGEEVMRGTLGSERPSGWGAPSALPRDADRPL